MKLKIDAPASIQLWIAIAGGLAAPIADRLLPNAHWVGWALFAIAMAIGLAAVLRVSFNRGDGLTRRERKLLRQQNEQGEYRRRLIKDLSFRYLIDCLDQGIEPESRTLAPETWLNEQLANRNEPFRVTVRDGAWADRDIVAV